MGVARLLALPFTSKHVAKILFFEAFDKLGLPPIVSQGTQRTSFSLCRGMRS